MTALLENSLWTAICAFCAVFFASLVLFDFIFYVTVRYRERYLQEARTELDDVLIQMPAAWVFDFSIAFSVFGAMVMIVLLMLTPADFSMQATILLALVTAVLLFPVPRLILKQLRVRRLHKFNLQLEDAINMIAGSLKAGFSINQALDEIAAQDVRPVSIEFRLLSQEIRLGVPLEQALDNMARRLDSEDFELVASAIATARKTGGELTGTLERVAALIRERVRIAGKVRAVTAMGRLQAVMIGAMPILLLLGLYQISPSLIAEFFSRPLGFIALGFMLLMDVCGFLWIRRITKIEV